MHKKCTYIYIHTSYLYNIQKQYNIQMKIQKICVYLKFSNTLCKYIYKYLQTAFLYTIDQLTFTSYIKICSLQKFRY